MHRYILLCQNILIVILILTLVGCQSSVRFSSSTHGKSTNSIPPSNSSSEQSLTALQRRIITSAESFLGVPYCYGGTSTKCTDCSGFVQQVFAGSGVGVPRTAAEQYAVGKEVESEEWSIGDLVFFDFSGGISHVGIYIGGGNIIHASTSKGVIRQPLSDDYLSSGFVGIRRILPALTGR
ncbi:MAG: C40 family peptidase [Candidatus Kapaibacterium sp.]